MAGSGVTIDNSDQNESAINQQHPKSLANISRSDSAVRFNLRLAQSSTAEVNTVISDLDTEKVNSVLAVRLCNWSRQPMLKLAQDGLIKIQSSFLSGSAESLQDFCKSGVCASLLS